MLILRFIFLTVNICWLIEASQYKRYKEIDVKLVSENDETFESKLREVLQISERLLQDIFVDGALNVGGGVNGYMNGVAQLILLAKNLISMDNEVMNALVKQIPIAIDLANVRQDIVNMEAKIKTILFNINNINGSNNIENEVKKSIVHDIHNDLFDMANIFDHHHSGLKYHPLPAVPLLFSLASIVAVYNRRSIIGCKLQQVLAEYQPLATVDRLTKVKIISALIPAHGYGSCE